MMKAINPATEAHKTGRVRPYWDQLFGKLDRLCKLQLIACPESMAHEQESRLSKYYKDLEQMYEHLSCGVRFIDPDTIKRFQVHDHFVQWLDGKGPYVSQITRDQVVHGHVNEWNDKLRLSVHIRRTDEDIQNERDHKVTMHNSLKTVFDRWRTERGKSFEEWFQEESRGFGKGILESYLKHMKHFARLADGADPLDDEILFPPMSSTLVDGLFREARQRGMTDDAALLKVMEYFTKAELTEIPFIRIGSCLYARMAEMMANGRKRDPSPGFSKDVETIETLLPYCDAMFLDNEMADLLNDRRVQEKLSGIAFAVSSKTGRVFMQYLESIEKDADPEFLRTVLDVYGPSWPEPYDSMYTDTIKDR